MLALVRGRRLSDVNLVGCELPLLVAPDVALVGPGINELTLPGWHGDPPSDGWGGSLPGTVRHQHYDLIVAYQPDRAIPEVSGW
jgi:hypothetical protein